MEIGVHHYVIAVAKMQVRLLQADPQKSALQILGNIPGWLGGFGFRLGLRCVGGTVMCGRIYYYIQQWIMIEITISTTHHKSSPMR